MFPKNASSEEIQKIKDFDYCYHDFENAILSLPEEFNGRNPHEAHDDIIEYLVNNKFATQSTQYKLRDWLFSRQRYWGEPIPLIHLKNEDVAALRVINDLNLAREENKAYILDFSNYLDDEDDGKEQFLVINQKIYSKIYSGLYGKIVCDYSLPLELPNVANFEPAGDGNSPLVKVEDFVNIQLAENLHGKRETNTMPQWGGSCWYYLRFMDKHNNESLVEKKVADYWGQVDSYV